MTTKVAFFTEMSFVGTVDRNYTNMRTEFAWMVALEAEHVPIHYDGMKKIPNNHFDIGILIVPKNNPELLDQMVEFKRICKKVGVMQEGPFWFYQDYSIINQLTYIKLFSLSDFILVHNKKDQKYFGGMFPDKFVEILPTLMIEDKLDEIKDIPKEDFVMIGGNFVSWYGGIDSYTVATAFGRKIVGPSMGRKQEGEESLYEHLPYLNWLDWMRELSKAEFGVHLMRTHAAGTFALNCAYLGIPCIGYKGLDTQEVLFPTTTVADGDIQKATIIANNLKNHPEEAKRVGEHAKYMYFLYYRESIFTDRVNTYFKKILESDGN